MYPYLFEGTPFVMMTWNVCFIIGAITAITLGMINRPGDFPLSRPAIFCSALLIVYASLLGGKLLSMLLYWQSLSQQGYTLRQMFAVSGYASLGSLSFEILALAAFVKVRIRRISFLKVADYYAPFLILGQAFMRIGCFFNGCCYGIPTDLPWGCVFPDVSSAPRHPTQLYNSIALFLNFFLMRYIYKKNPRPGITLFSSLFMFGTLRFFIEFLRVDSIPVFGIITLAQVTLLGIAGISVLAVLTILILKKR
ncbi:MAG: hypothetical protein DRP85_02420 [Candidatus Makaraimicrobium thalassicum]|nr:MAG: hypothetical protein DRP85_02420 [Candidatus Omnitrophota bacterium]